MSCHSAVKHNPCATPSVAAYMQVDLPVSVSITTATPHVTSSFSCMFKHNRKSSGKTTLVLYQYENVDHAKTNRWRHRPGVYKFLLYAQWADIPASTYCTVDLLKRCWLSPLVLWAVFVAVWYRFRRCFRTIRRSCVELSLFDVLGADDQPLSRCLGIAETVA